MLSMAVQRRASNDKSPLQIHDGLGDVEHVLHELLAVQDGAPRGVLERGVDVVPALYQPQHRLHHLQLVAKPAMEC